MIALIFVLVVSSVFAAEAEEKDTAYRIRRGVNNLTLGWLEIPRNIKYEDAKTPYAGFFYGLVKGPVMTVWRTAAGAVDVVALGQTGPGLYMNQIPDTVTEAKWHPDPEEKKAKAKLQKKAKKELKPKAMKAEKKIRKTKKETDKKIKKGAKKAQVKKNKKVKKVKKVKTDAEKAEAKAKREARKAKRAAAEAAKKAKK